MDVRSWECVAGKVDQCPSRTAQDAENESESVMSSQIKTEGGPYAEPVYTYRRCEICVHDVQHLGPPYREMRCVVPVQCFARETKHLAQCSQLATSVWYVGGEVEELHCVESGATSDSRMMRTGCN